MNREESQAVAKLLKALGHPVRLTIVEMLRRGELCVCEIQPLLQRDPSTLSRHVSQLKACGVIEEKQQGTRRMLRLADPQLMKLVAIARDMIGRRLTQQLSSARKWRTAKGYGRKQ